MQARGTRKQNGVRRVEGAVIGGEGKAGLGNPCARWVVGGGAFAITLSPASESDLVLAIINQ